MSEAPATDPWVIKVLDSKARQSALLGPGPLSLGYALDNDIVLRDPVVKGCRAILDLAGAPQAGIRMVEGQAEFLGQVLSVPSQAILPPYVPFSLGGMQIAYGQPDSPRWEEAWRLARVVRSAAPLSAKDTVPPPSAAGLFGRAASYLPAAFALLALWLAVAAATGGGHASAHASIPAGAPAPSGPPSASIATRTEDAFLSLGIPATAAADRAGGVTVSIPADSDPAVADQARRQVLLGAPSLKRVQIAFVQPKAPAASIPHGGAKRIVAAVSGPSGYLLTSDGSRYFTGARLPTGQVLKSIDQNTVVFDQDGVTTQLELRDDGGRP